jgi:DNA mismatch repair ATPase MutL
VSTSVEITSKTLDSPHAYKRRYFKGKVEGSVEKASQLRSKTSGFIVIVENLLASLPVRQKVAHQKSIQVEEIRCKLQQICLINPSVSIECRNDSNSSMILKYSGCTCFTEAFKLLFGKSFNLLEEFFQHGSFFLSSFVGKELYRSKNYQFVYVNKKFVGRGKIHRYLGEGFSKMLLANNNVEQSNQNSNDEEKSKKPSKEKKYPVFLLNIKCAFNLYDITLEPAKTRVEFKDFDTLKKGLDGLLLNFQATFSSISNLSLSSQGCSNQNNNNKKKKKKDKDYSLIADKSKTRDGDLNQSASLNISTHDVKRAIHSRLISRDSPTTPDVPGGEDEAADGNHYMLGPPPRRRLPSSSRTMSSTDRAPAAPAVKLTQVSKKKSPVKEVISLKTSRKRGMSDLRIVRGKIKQDNILTRAWKPKHPPAAKPSLTKPLFERFRSWNGKNFGEKSSSSSDSSIELAPPLKVKKPNTKKKTPPPAAVGKADDDDRVDPIEYHCIDPAEKDTLRWKMRRYLQDIAARKDSQNVVSEKSENFSTQPDPSNVESSASSKSSPVMKTQRRQRIPKAVSAPAAPVTRVPYLSQSPASSPPPRDSKDLLDKSVEIVDITDDTDTNDFSDQFGIGFYLNEGFQTGPINLFENEEDSVQEGSAIDETDKCRRYVNDLLARTEEGMQILDELFPLPVDVQPVEATDNGTSHYFSQNTSQQQSEPARRGRLRTPSVMFDDEFEKYQ